MELTEKDSEIRALIEENVLWDRIDFVGFQRGDALTQLISGASCILCPAIWYENMPNTVIEAYAYGKPVIASNMGCFPELLEDGKTGYLFRPKDAKDLADKIVMLMVHENERLQMGKWAREKVERDFSPENHFRKLEKLFG